MLFSYQTKRYAADVENKRGQYEHYNILPLYAVGVKPAIMELPEVCMFRIHALTILLLLMILSSENLTL
jgi:callose synthase